MLKNGKSHSIVIYRRKFSFNGYLIEYVGFCLASGFVNWVIIIDVTLLTFDSTYVRGRFASTRVLRSRSFLAQNAYHCVVNCRINVRIVKLLFKRVLFERSEYTSLHKSNKLTVSLWNCNKKTEIVRTFHIDQM
jgi:hypothetical protein